MATPIVFGNHADPGWTSEKPDGWWNHGVCRDVDPRLFEPMPGDVAGNLKALAVCARCPAWVKAECLAEAFETGDDTTVRGETTPEDRRSIRKRANMDDFAAGLIEAAPSAHRTVCDNGHAQTPENVYLDPDGHRCCNVCKTDTQREYRQRKTAREAAEREQAKADER